LLGREDLLDYAIFNKQEPPAHSDRFTNGDTFAILFVSALNFRSNRASNVVLSYTNTTAWCGPGFAAAGTVLADADAAARVRTSAPLGPLAAGHAVQGEAGADGHSSSNNPEWLVPVSAIAVGLGTACAGTSPSSSFPRASFSSACAGRRSRRLAITRTSCLLG
jgi:hypothetical protein